MNGLVITLFVMRLDYYYLITVTVRRQVWVSE